MGSHLPRPPFCPVLFRGCAQTGPSPRPPPAGGTGVMHRQPCRSHLPLREPQRPQCRRAACPRPTSQVLGCGEREIKEEKATPHVWSLGSPPHAWTSPWTSRPNKQAGVEPAHQGPRCVGEASLWVQACSSKTRRCQPAGEPPGRGMAIYLCSCLEIPTERAVWVSLTVCRVAKSRTQLK